MDVSVEPHDVTAVPSFAAGVADILSLAHTVQTQLRDPAVSGVVVTHGTDTMEEAAFLLALSHGGPAPVVLTGAQRPADDPTPDGPRNLAAALRWAADPRSDASGVTVAFADAILPAIGVRKTHSLAVATFAAPGRGPIAHVDEGGTRRHATPVRPAPLLDHEPADLPRVDVVSLYLGADATAVHAARDAGAHGIVLAGFGAGNATPAVTEASLHLLDEGIPVLLASRTGAGPVAGLYAGGGADLVAAGAVPAGDLSPWQARLLLAAVLATEPDRARVDERCRSWLTEAGAR